MEYQIYDWLKLTNYKKLNPTALDCVRYMFLELVRYYTSKQYLVGKSLEWRNEYSLRVDNYLIFYRAKKFPQTNSTIFCITNTKIGITDFGAVVRAMAEDSIAMGCKILYNFEATNFTPSSVGSTSGTLVKNNSKVQKYSLFK